MFDDANPWAAIEFHACGVRTQHTMHQEKFWIRRAESGDESLLLKIRLEALSESPEAFGSTLDRERARTPVDWQKWLSPSATFVLETKFGPQGIVAGVPDATDAAVVHLMAMWVHPSLRGSGVASALVQTVLAWAEERGAGSVRLDVIEDNDRARRLYERHGFRATGHITVRPRDGARELQMERRLGVTLP
jgi:ribosomal protein S18 acetylase RimI-like enzyme